MEKAVIALLAATVLFLIVGVLENLNVLLKNLLGGSTGALIGMIVYFFVLLWVALIIIT